jgi:hypothetical protein
MKSKSLKALIKSFHHPFPFKTKNDHGSAISPVYSSDKKSSSQLCKNGYGGIWIRIEIVSGLCGVTMDNVELLTDQKPAHRQARSFCPQGQRYSERDRSANKAPMMQC